MSVIRTVFLGTPFIAKECLKALVEDEHFEVVGVVSQPDRPAGRKMQLKASEVSAYALEHKLPLIRPEKADGEEFIQSIKKWGAECVVVVAYGQILRKDFLDMFPQKVVNVHASLLPRWRGAAPIQRAMMAGDQETGVCLQVMTESLDAGAVLGARKMIIQDAMNAIDLHNAMIPLAQDLLTVDFMDYMRGNLSPTPQEESLVTYAKKIKKSESQMDWSLPNREIFNRQRGLMMGPGATTVFRGKPIKIHRMELVNDLSLKAAPGVIVDVNKSDFTVQCGEGQLKILELQPASKACQTSAQFLLGHKIAKGEVFGE
ncbi:MAG: methionyl-tRNA formyltransferase [Bdellovibrionales bacterium]|nr:methionyl-tRNA formyltransferase [Bdellovibrionales bacterium]